MNGRNVTFMLAVLLAYVAQGAIWYTMPLIFSQTLASDYFAVGVLISLIPLIEVLGAVPFGFFADFGRIKAIVFDSMLALLVVPFLFATNIELLNSVGVFLLGVGGVGVWIGATAHVSNVMGKKNVKFIGYDFAVMGVGWVAGPILGGFIYGGFGNVPLAVTELLLIAIASFLFMKSMRFASDVSRRHTPKFSKLLSIKDGLVSRMPRYVVPFLFSAFMYSFFAYAVWVSVPLITRLSSATVLLGGIVIGVLGIPFAFGDSLGGRLYVRGHTKTLVGVAMVASAAFVFAAAFLLKDSFFSLIILSASALLVTLADVWMFSAVVDIDRQDSGEIAALSVVSGGFGGALGAVVAGATIVEFRLYAVAAVFGAMALLYVVLLFGVMRRTRF